MQLDLPRKLYGNAVFLAAAMGRKRIAYRDPAEVRRMRNQRFQRLIRFAAETVPFYRDWFRVERLDFRDFRTPDDLDRLPILEKSTVSQNPELFRSTSESGRQAVRFTTSGSTGFPLIFYHDRRSIIANMAFSEPGRSVQAELIGKRFGYRSLAINRSNSTDSKIRNFCNANTMVPRTRQFRRLDLTEPPETAVAAIREWKPEVLVGYGSYLEMFFRYVRERHIDLPLPRLVHFAADGMTTPGRQLITDEFGIPVVGSYAAVECFKIGFQCSHGTGYHLYEDLCHSRIVDERGETLGPGKSGSVIITNLVNRGTILLNYRLGDIGSLSGQPCNCGRTLRLLEDLEGRIEDMLILPEGRFVHPRAIWAVLRNSRGLLRYQFIQHGLHRFELNLVTTSEDSYRQIRENALPNLSGILERGSQIETNRLDRIMPDASGKFRPIVSKCR
jgi:phenylacetate-CoA ligase